MGSKGRLGVKYLVFVLLLIAEHVDLHERIVSRAGVEMRMLHRIEFDLAASVHLQTHPPILADALDGHRA